MAAQQETPIGDEDLDALMAELEAETVGMVAPPPAVVKTTAAPAKEEDPLADLDEVVLASTSTSTPGEFVGSLATSLANSAKNTGVPLIEDDPLAGLDDTEHLTSTAANSEHLAKSIAQANAGKVSDHALVEPNIEDELASLDAEMGASVAAAKQAVVAPSAMDKIAAKAAAVKKTHPSDVPKVKEPVEEAKLEEVVKAAQDHDLNEKLAELATSMPNPNPPPEEKTIKRPGAALAGLDFEIDIDKFRSDISVSETTLDKHMMEQAGNFAYYAELAARAEAQAKRTKVQVEMAEAKLYNEHRKDLMAKVAISGEGKVTEKMIESAVLSDPRYGSIQNRLIEAESRAAIAKGCVEAMKQHRDMIIQLGADRREDGKGAVRIMAAAQSHTDMKARAAALAKGE